MIWTVLAFFGCGAGTPLEDDAGGPAECNPWEVESIARVGAGGGAVDFVASDGGSLWAVWADAGIHRWVGNIELAGREIETIDPDATANDPSQWVSGGSAEYVYTAGAPGARQVHRARRRLEWEVDVVDDVRGEPLPRISQGLLDEVTHVSFVEEGGDGSRVRHGTDGSGAWIVETVAEWPGADEGSSFRLSFESMQSILHVAWAQDGSVFEASNDGAAWSNELVAEGGEYRCPAIFDTRDGSPAGVRHIAVLESTDLVYGTDASGDWTFERIDAGAEVLGARMAFHPKAPTPELCYVVRGESGAELRYATPDVAGWRIETIAEEGHVDIPRGCRSAPIAVGSDGRPHVVYYDPDAGELLHAARTGCR